MHKFWSMIESLRMLHPFVYSIFPIISLYATNIDNLYFKETYRSLLFSIAFCFVTLLISRAMLKTWEKACLLSAPIMLWFFSYGHIYIAIEDWQILSIPIGRHRYLVILSFCLLAAWAHIIRSKPLQTKRLNVVLFVMAIAMLSYPVSMILFGRSSSIQSNRLSNDFEITLNYEDSDQDLPDIYYIILDGYARADILETLYDYDNSVFLSALEARGFYIADQSHSNYAQTLLSLGSSLNLNYVNFLEEELGPTSKNRAPLEELIHHNRVRQLLAELGYSLVAFDTPLPGTTITDADNFYKTNTKSLLLAFSPFEGQLAETSFIRFFIDAQLFIDQEWGQNVIEPGYEAHRNRTIYVFHHLVDAANLAGPQFVFAHIVAPHPPFIFNANGERLSHFVTFTLKDGSQYYSSREEYLQLYRDQLIYINTLTLDAVDEIIDVSETPPIIIIQGDHGPGAYLDWENINNTDLNERFSILNAYYFPEADEGWLYPEITPVNTFRILFNRYFSTEFDLLPDRYFFSGWETPYLFVEVNDKISE